MAWIEATGGAADRVLRQDLTRLKNGVSEREAIGRKDSGAPSTLVVAMCLFDQVGIDKDISFSITCIPSQRQARKMPTCDALSGKTMG
ncbi:uncharacterized protein PV07_03825 [Cladophialophora immunda]|uniref:Uncharacterized protein n=1 Tax=Cladophialophora immunda TaxID=569365 RepID=A0A0D2CQK4_9EURO|nr:uncharacterized protein PV07_03825 [Cladophialophora immunda]KIW32265.1 hypothetical protein PV07_03825 [Cladophialophora immunda]